MAGTVQILSLCLSVHRGISRHTVLHLHYFLNLIQALEKANPQPGQRILITGASGGVGHIAVQLAKYVFKLHVTASASGKHSAWLQELGADSVSDYTVGIEQSLAPYINDKFDIIVDVIGGPLLEYAVTHTLKATGLLSAILNRGTGPDAVEAYKKRIAAEATYVQPNGSQLTKIAEVIDSGKLKVKVALELPLEEAGKAHDIVLDGHAGGKVVLIL